MLHNGDARDANGWTQVYHCTYRLDARRCVLWLGRGANPNLRVLGRTALHLAVSGPFLAAYNEEAATTIVLALLDHGANLEARMLGDRPPEAGTPLECAIYCNNVEMVKLLLSKGADIDLAVIDYGHLRNISNADAYAIIEAVVDGGGYESFTRAHRHFLCRVLLPRDGLALNRDSVGHVLGFLSRFDGSLPMGHL